LMKSSEM